MSLDLYAGPLATFYTRQFETPQARGAREAGLEYRLVYDGEPIKWLSPETAKDKVAEFQRHLSEKSDGKLPAQWNESSEAIYVEQLFAGCRDALVLLAAYVSKPQRPFPTTAPASLEDDPVYAGATGETYLFGPISILESNIWLPADADVTLFANDPMGWELFVSTHSNLAYALKRLSKHVWNDETDVEKWAARGPAPGRGLSYQKRKWRMPWQSEFIKSQEPAPQGALMWDAEYAFAIFSQALEFARKHNVPIRIDV